jgi:hypothetical protein
MAQPFPSAEPGSLPYDAELLGHLRGLGPHVRGAGRWIWYWGRVEPAMRYVVRCRCCSHGDIACDELRNDQRCPHCQSVPSTYTDRGEGFC